ncbi:uncharacterized protein H6S33_007051 [Morchella sextelata]|uniref:uncharacterized protein n=1 Tax=Morchella sextelata TaxID=1174677 RepID=UPI001D049A92|nr:uncharacterized protein H6S33_007051 [Morchella sextelata]KAH0604020.1 hypothetical protein H6S33_007051 [Morchella sextelata]
MSSPETPRIASCLITACTTHIRKLSRLSDKGKKYHYRAPLCHEFGRFFLWTQGFDKLPPAEGNILDEVLEEATYLKKATILLLASFASCLLDVTLSKVGDDHTRTLLRRSLDEVDNAYPHLEGRIEREWETQDASIGELRECIDALFDVLPTLDNVLEDMQGGVTLVPNPVELITTGMDPLWTGDDAALQEVPPALGLIPDILEMLQVEHSELVGGETSAPEEGQGNVTPVPNPVEPLITGVSPLQADDDTALQEVPPALGEIPDVLEVLQVEHSELVGGDISDLEEKQGDVTPVPDPVEPLITGVSPLQADDDTALQEVPPALGEIPDVLEVLQVEHSELLGGHTSAGGASVAMAGSEVGGALSGSENHISLAEEREHQELLKFILEERPASPIPITGMHWEIYRQYIRDKFPQAIKELDIEEFAKGNAQCYDSLTRRGSDEDGGVLGEGGEDEHKELGEKELGEKGLEEEEIEGEETGLASKGVPKIFVDSGLGSSAPPPTGQARSIHPHPVQSNMLVPSGIPASGTYLKFPPSVSAVSYSTICSTSSEPNNRRLLPRVPLHSVGSAGFECTFCGLMQRPTTQGHRWRKHVFADLAPYMCIRSRCPSADKFYTKKRDWVAHDSQCIRDGREGAEVTTTETCPFCLKEFGGDTGRFYSHVAHHMEDIRLFALPPAVREYEVGEDEDTSRTGSSEYAENSGADRGPIGSYIAKNKVIDASATRQWAVQAHGEPPGGYQAKMPGHITAAECLKRFQAFIKYEKKGLDVFYGGTEGEEKLKECASKAEVMLKALLEKGCTGEIAKDLSTLVLFDVVMLIGDSSMILEENGERIKTLQNTMNAITDVYDLANDDGILSVQFLNSAKGKRNITGKRVQTVLNNHCFQGLTMIGKMLEKRVLNQFVFKSPMKKPLLVIIITGGEIEGEKQGLLRMVLNTCAKKCERDSQRGRDAVAFQFSRVGNDEGAEELLKTLDDDYWYHVNCLPVGGRLENITGSQKWIVLRELLLGALMKAVHDDDGEYEVNGDKVYDEDEDDEDEDVEDEEDDED